MAKPLLGWYLFGRVNPLKNLPFRPEMMHRRSSQSCIESRFRYPNGLLENYQQKFHTPSGEGILQGANGCHPVITFHLSFKPKLF
jgi:hypothetical protein